MRPRTNASGPGPKKGRAKNLRSERGNAAVELALLAPILLVMLVGAVDMGMLIRERMQLASAARAGIQYAIQGIGNAGDTAGMQAAATGATNLVAANIVATAACECSDGTAVVCTGVCGDSEMYVRVGVTESYRTFFSYPLIDNPVSLAEDAIVRIR